MSIIVCKDKSGRPIKKDGLTKYRVRVNFTVSGPEGPHYRRIEKIAFGKEQAKEIESSLTSEAVRQSSAPGDTPPTFSDLADTYIVSSSTSGTLRPSTVTKKQEVLSHHLLPFLGSYPLDKITRQVVYAWMDYINAKGLSIKMRRNIFADLKAICTFAVKRGWYKVSPLLNVDNFRDSQEIPTAHQEMSFYTAADFELFVDGLRRTRPGNTLLRYLTLFYILFFTGCRKGEANALKWVDYDPAAETLYIRRSVNMKSRGGYTESVPKTPSSFRKIPISRQVVDILSRQLSYQRQDPAWTDQWYICGGPSPIPDTSIEKANASAAQAANLPHIRIHDFRHSHASLLINHGVMPKAIARRLGHSTVDEVLNRYGHLYPEQDNAIIALLNGL